MSAKSKALVAASPTETIVTVERMAAIQRAAGSTFVFGATCPGRRFSGTSNLKLYLTPSRCPFGWVRFHVTTIAQPGNNAFSWMRFREHPGGSLSPSEKVINFPWSENRDYVILYRSLFGLGRGPVVNPAFTPKVSTVQLHLDFFMDTQNGDPTTEANCYVKNIVVGGCPTAAVPFLVTQSGATAERVIEVGI
jgi:hypothetical protein